MNINWNFTDSLFPNFKEVVEKDFLARKCISGVYGEMSECDGDFQVTLLNGDTLTYKYTFAPHLSLEKPGATYFKVNETNYGKEAVDFILENYSHDSPIILGVLRFYILHVKLEIA